MNLKDDMHNSREMRAVDLKRDNCLSVGDPAYIMRAMTRGCLGIGHNVGV